MKGSQRRRSQKGRFVVDGEGWYWCSSGGGGRVCWAKKDFDDGCKGGGYTVAMAVQRLPPLLKNDVMLIVRLAAWWRRLLRSSCEPAAGTILLLHAVVIMIF